MNEETKSAELQDWRDYHRLQYDRIAQHENQRLTFTNVVLVVSSAVFLFGTRIPEVTSLQLTVLSILVVLINFAAIMFIDESRYWVKYHQNRAKFARKRFGSDLPSDEPESGEKAYDFVPKPQNKKYSDSNPFRRTELQKIIHLALIAIAVLIAATTWL